jgi:hypothetical protein
MTDAPIPTPPPKEPNPVGGARDGYQNPLYHKPFASFEPERFVAMIQSSRMRPVWTATYRLAVLALLGVIAVRIPQWKEMPSVDVGWLPSVRVDSLPSVRVDSLPIVSVGSLPRTLPSVSVDSLPSVRVSSLPGVSVDSLPSVRVSSLPSVSVDSLPEPVRVFQR